MRIYIRHKMTSGEADQLIERYYEGLTTGAEEQQLRAFLSQSNLPERYRPEQAIFGYFEGKKKKKRHFSLQPYIRWASVAMLIFTAGLIMQRFMDENNSDFAYVNGKKITDIRQVKSYAENSLKSLSTGASGECLRLNNKDLIKQQLSDFAE